MIKLQDDEQIALIARKHWFPLVMRTIGLLFLLLLPPVAYYGTLQFEGLPLATALAAMPTSLIVFLLASWVLIIWMQFFRIWTDHYLDGWVITDRRIIDIDQHGFFNRRLGSFRLERVQDVTIEVQGFIATLLNFGDIHVQTAGEAQDFIIRGIPRPREVKQVVLAHVDRSIIEDRAGRTRDATA